MSLLSLHNLRYGTGALKARVTAAIARSAQNVLNESSGASNHAARLVWAQSALDDAPAMAERMMWGILGNSTIAGAGDDSTDNDILFVIASLIDIYASA